jgi:hypothetical protein
MTMVEAGFYIAPPLYSTTTDSLFYLELTVFADHVVGSLCCLCCRDVIEPSITAVKKPLLPQVEG